MSAPSLSTNASRLLTAVNMASKSSVAGIVRFREGLFDLWTFGHFDRGQQWSADKKSIRFQDSTASELIEAGLCRVDETGNMAVLKRITKP